MKKTNLLLLAASALAGLASCAGGSSPSSGASSVDGGKTSGIEAFCDYFKTAKNYTITYDENNYGTVVQVVEGAVMNLYTAEMKEGGYYVDSGYFSVPGKGIYNMDAVSEGVLESGYIYSTNVTDEPAELLMTTPSFFGEIGDGVWKDTEDKNVFTATNGKLLTFACSFLGWSSYEDYVTEGGVKLTFDDVDDIHTATISLTLDMSAAWGSSEYVYDLSASIGSLGETEIAGFAALKADPKLYEGVPEDWDETIKEAMVEYVGEVLPSFTWSYASYAGDDGYGDFVLVDLQGAGKGATYGALLEKAGWVVDEADTYIGDEGSNLYYTKEIPVTEDCDGGYYLIEIDDIPASTYASYGDSYAAQYPNGSLQLTGYRVDYTSYETFQAFFTGTTYVSGATIAAPAFESTPSKIVFTDQSMLGAYWYGMNSWYVFQGTFADSATARKELMAWAETVTSAEKWELDLEDYESYGYIYCLYDTYTVEEEGEEVEYCNLQLTIQVDLGDEESGIAPTGAFLIDIEE